MSWFPESIIDRHPRPDEFGLIVRPIFSGSDPGILTVQLASGSLNLSLSGSFSSDPTRPNTSVVTSASFSTSTVLLAAANNTRRVLTVYNDSNRNLYLKNGPSASLGDWNVRLPPNAYFEEPQPIWQGEVTCVWAAGGSGYARVNELTP